MLTEEEEEEEERDKSERSWLSFWKKVNWLACQRHLTFSFFLGHLFLRVRVVFSCQGIFFLNFFFFHPLALESGSHHYISKLSNSTTYVVTLIFHFWPPPQTLKVIAAGPPLFLSQNLLRFSFLLRKPKLKPRCLTFFVDSCCILYKTFCPLQNKNLHWGKTTDYISLIYI